MPKRKPGTGRGERAARMGAKNPRELRAYVDLLQKQQDAILSLADRMEKNKITTVALDGVTKFDKGAELCYEFIDAMDMAIRKELRKLGRDD